MSTSTSTPVSTVLIAVALLREAIDAVVPAFFRSNLIEKQHWDAAFEATFQDVHLAWELEKEVNRCLQFLKCRKAEIQQSCQASIQGNPEASAITEYLGILWEQALPAPDHPSSYVHRPPVD